MLRKTGFTRFFGGKSGIKTRKSGFTRFFRWKKGYLKPKIRFFGILKNTDPTPRKRGRKDTEGIREGWRESELQTPRELAEGWSHFYGNETLNHKELQKRGTKEENLTTDKQTVNAEEECMEHQLSAAYNYRVFA